MVCPSRSRRSFSMRSIDSRLDRNASMPQWVLALVWVALIRCSSVVSCAALNASPRPVSSSLTIVSDYALQFQHLHPSGHVARCFRSSSALPSLGIYPRIIKGKSPNKQKRHQRRGLLS
ncbi:hypothetical protein F4780DRAFT_724105 [Xylariomycetidae sp. FL0641]|nr:hypothetical protein F4780DRAFT_724105 [Xylariomycetidae sp. FL0641]